MRKILRIIREAAIEIFGNAAWEGIAWKGAVAVLIALLYAGWSYAVSPLGPITFLAAFGIAGVTLLLLNDFQYCRVLGKWERGEIPIPPVLQSVQEEIVTARLQIAELQAKIAAIEDIQPRLIDEPTIICRTITYAQQPQYVSVGGGGSAPRSYHYNARDSVFFALLRITNAPESTNRLAIARSLCADITYCDLQGRQFFPSISGVWVEPNHEREVKAIGRIFSDCPPLQPNGKAYLGLILGYFSNHGQVEYGALTASSPAYRDWLHPETLLSSGVFADAVNIKVTIRCDRFRTISYYVLEVNKKEQKFLLKQTLIVQ